MAYSAGSGGPPPATTTGQNSNQSNTSQNQSSNQSSNQSNTSTGSDIIVVDLNLQRLFADRKNKLAITNPKVNAIQNATERSAKNQIAKKGEFYYSNRKMVKPGTSYHTHYTSQLTQHFMTGGEHNSGSELIYPLKRDISNFIYYNSLNKQSPLKLNNNVTIPTDDDYKNVSYQRYFAKQANDKNQPAFEISKDDFGSSALYEYIQIDWHITGTRNSVYSRNIKEINRASNTIPSIKKILSPFQFYRYVEDLSDVDELRRRLGMMDLSDYNTTTQSSAFGTNTGGGSAGTCSLGSQYTTQEACEAAGGVWTDGFLTGEDIYGDEINPPKMC